MNPSALGISLQRVVFGLLLILSSRSPGVYAADSIRIGLPAKAYWSTVTTQAAEDMKLFEKEGLTPEVTFFRGTGDAFEALAAGSTDLILASPSQVAAGITRGIPTKMVAGGANHPNGWYLVVPEDSGTQRVTDLKGKKVGVAAAGTMTDLFARWAGIQSKVDLNRVAVGSGGIIPNLLSGNVDGAVVFAPLSYQVVSDKKARLLMDFGAEMPPMLSEGWIATDNFIAEKPAVVQRALNALYGGLDYVLTHRDYAIKSIAAVHGVPESVAVQQYEGVVMKLLRNGEMKTEWIQAWLDLAALGGMTGLAPADATFTTRFKPIPTQP